MRGEMQGGVSPSPPGKGLARKFWIFFHFKIHVVHSAALSYTNSSFICNQMQGNVRYRGILGD